MQLVKLPKDIAIPDNLTTVEYHELLAYFHFKSEANPSKVEYKRAYKECMCHSQKVAVMNVNETVSLWH